MKSTILLGLVFFATTGFAQTKTATPKKSAYKALTPAQAELKTRTPSTTEGREWYRGKFSFGPVMSNSTVLKDVNLKENRQKTGSGELTTDTGFALMGEYADRLAPRWNWTTALTVYSERTINSYKGTRNGFSGTEKIGDKPTFQSWVVSGGAQYKVNDMVYVPVALNLPILNLTKNGDMDGFAVRPQLGYQFGIGGLLQKTVALELMYQSLRYGIDGEYQGIDVEGDARMEGFNIQARYLF